MDFLHLDVWHLGCDDLKTTAVNRVSTQGSSAWSANSIMARRHPGFLDTELGLLGVLSCDQGRNPMASAAQPRSHMALLLLLS